RRRLDGLLAGAQCRLPRLELGGAARDLPPLPLELGHRGRRCDLRLPCRQRRLPRLELLAAARGVPARPLDLTRTLREGLAALLVLLANLHQPLPLGLDRFDALVQRPLAPRQL